MRLDKYLKVSRLVKRRPVANELCGAGNVEIDGKTAKPSSDVEPGQILTLRFGNRLLEVRVVTVPQKPVPVQQAASLYEVLRDERMESPL